jgi:hypothetical protein
MDKGVSATGFIVLPARRRLVPALLKLSSCSVKSRLAEMRNTEQSGRDETHQAHAELTRRRGVSLKVIRGGIAGVMHE